MIRVAQERRLSRLIIKGVDLRRQGNMISPLKWYSGSAIGQTIHYRPRLQLHQDRWCSLYIRSESWKRADVFDMLDSTQFLNLYQNEDFAPLSLIYSIDKLSASPSPLFMLPGDSCTFVCLNEDVTHQSGK